MQLGRLFGSFRRGVGAAADLRELEYISALHQTALPDLRVDATISSTDIGLHLRSRYGIDVPIDDAVDIVRGLGGTLEHHPADFSDSSSQGSSDRRNGIRLRKERRMLSGSKNVEPTVHSQLTTVDESQDVELGSLDEPDKLEHNNEADSGATVGVSKVDLEGHGSTIGAPTGYHGGSTEQEQPTPEDAKDALDNNSTESGGQISAIEDAEESAQGREEEFLDLVQLTTAILIPTLCRAAKEVELRYAQHGHGKDFTIDEKVDEWVDPHESLLNCSAVRDPIDFFRGKNSSEREAREKAERESLRPRPRRIIREVLRIMLASTDDTEISRSKVLATKVHRDRLPPLRRFNLSERLLKDLLIAHGEFHAASDGALIEQMVAAAGGVGTFMDERAFARALTSDLTNWKVGVEDRLSTIFFDVYGFENADQSEYRVATAFAGAVAHEMKYATGVIGTAARNIGRKTGALGEVTGEAVGAATDIVGETAGIVKGAGLAVETVGDVVGAAADATVGAAEAVATTADFVVGTVEIAVKAGDVSKDIVEHVAGVAAEATTRDATGEVHGVAATTEEAKPAPTGGASMQGATDTSLSQSQSAHAASTVEVPQHSHSETSQFVSDSMQSDKNDDEAVHGTTSSSATLNKGGSPPEESSDIKLPTHTPTAPYIDYSVDNYRSLGFLMYLWVFYLFSILVYMTILRSTGWNAVGCDPSFGCNLGAKIWNWLSIALVLTIGGMIIIVPISFGNDPYERDWKVVAFSMIMVATYSIIPFLGLKRYKDRIPSDGELNELEKTLSQEWIAEASVVYLIFGGLAFVKLIFHLVSCVTPRDTILKNRFYRMLLLPSNVTATTDVKQAATHKVNALLENALDLHLRPVRGEKHKNAMENFVLKGERYEDCGGLVWTWKRFLSNDLLNKDGVWIFSRLAVGQEAQVIVLGFMILVLVRGTKQAAEKAEERRTEVSEDPWIPDHIKEDYLKIIPEDWMIYSSFYPGGAIGLLVGALLILIYLPSTVSTVFKLRCGVIPTLYNPRFPKYRISADTTYYNVGNIVYALVGSVGFFFVIFAGLIFLFLWPISRDSMGLFAAWFLGMMITIGLKMCMTMFCRLRFQAALYRKQPRKANFWSLAMECWNVGLGGGVMVGRLCQFLLASAFWIGRVDVTFLDEDVNLLGYSFDYTPTNFRKEILVHEAHRHPFIERLGAMYLMRLKHGKEFSSDAGACWRRLFVLALMPWLIRYRQKPPDEEEEDDLLFATLVMSSKKLSQTMQQGKLGPTSLFRRMGKQMGDLAGEAVGYMADERPKERKVAKSKKQP